MTDQPTLEPLSEASENKDVDPEIERDAISELRTGTDPSKWAGEFVRLFEGEVVSWRTTPLTPTLMQAWFSAAIQAGHEAGIKVGRDVGLEEWRTHAANLECERDDLVHWKDRAVIAERKLEYLKQAIANA